MSDWQLLEDYAKRNSEEAFRELVNRYAGLVYQAALRRVRNTHTAQDVTQAVFIALAQKGRTMPRGTILSGWLHRATRYAVANVAREALRRQRREQEVCMDETNLQAGGAESAWEQIAPHLDNALDTLSQRDREALLARFFEDKSHSELAATLGVSEDAAKVRVSRALAKLRVVFARRGFVLPSATLLAALSGFAAAAAPAGLTTSVTTVALTKGASGAVSAVALANGILKLMVWNKLKAAAVVVATLLLGAGVITATGMHRQRGAGVLAPPAAADFDRASPKGTLRFLARALEAGDGQGASTAVQLGAGTNPQAETAVATLVRGQAGFKQALLARFGERNVAQALQRWRLLQVPVAGLDEAEERIDGDSAIVRWPGGSSLQFVRTTEGWRLVLASANDPATVAQFLLAGRLMLDAAAELNEGKYRTTEEVFSTLQSRLIAGR